ncbi:hypothetical protein TYRP_005948 [Tyrophagus putrescentiae]|nr:hypothetical protein TYRP_005948 [Tyrophagus putrescentiae]
MVASALVSSSSASMSVLFVWLLFHGVHRATGASRVAPVLLLRGGAPEDLVKKAEEAARGEILAGEGAEGVVSRGEMALRFISSKYRLERGGIESRRQQEDNR